MFNEVEKMIDQEQVARTLINLIDVAHQENWVLLNTKDMAKQTEEYFIRFFSEHGKAEATDEIKEVTRKNQDIFDKITSGNELNAKEMRDFMECVYYDREPQSGFTLAYDTIKIIYAAYMSAELGNKVELNAF